MKISASGVQTFWLHKNNIPWKISEIPVGEISFN